MKDKNVNSLWWLCELRVHLKCTLG